jgi:hypothetical protein
MEKQSATINELVDFLKENMATKEDLKNLEEHIWKDMATKKDLQTLEKSIRKDMATKEDIDHLRTDMNIGLRKVDVKIDSLINVLSKDGIIRQERAQHLIAQGT